MESAMDPNTPERTVTDGEMPPVETPSKPFEEMSGKDLVSAASAAAAQDPAGYGPLRARLETHPGSAVVKQLEAWEKELDVLEREEGLLMQGQWKLLREQMGSMMEGLAETKSQIAELKRNLRNTSSEASRSHTDLRETETRLTSALAWEREQRVTLGPELQDMVRKGLRDEAAARKAWAQAQAAATAEINVKLEDYAKKVEDIEPIWREIDALRHILEAEQQDRKVACKELSQQIRVLRDRVDEADADQKDTLRSLKEMIDRTIDKTEENFQEFQLQIEGLNSEMGERGNQQVEAVQARCRDLSEEVASRMADLTANFEKVAAQRMGSQASLEHRLDELALKVEEESSQRQNFAQEVIESVESSREATSKALQAMGAELDRRFDEDDLNRSSEQGGQLRGNFSEQLSLQEELVLLRRRVEDLESQNSALRGSKDRGNELRLEDLARDVQELKENASVKAVEAELKEVKSQAFQSPMSSVGATTTATLWDFSKNSARGGGGAPQTSPGRRCASPYQKNPGCQGCCLCLTPTAGDAASPTLSARSKEAADAKACLLEFARNIKPKKTSPRYQTTTAADRGRAESCESDENGSEVQRSRTQTGQSGGDGEWQGDNRASIASLPEGYFAGVGRSSSEPATVKAAQDLNAATLNPTDANRRQVGENLSTQYEKGCLGENLIAAQKQAGHDVDLDLTPRKEADEEEEEADPGADIDRKRSTRSVGFTLDSSSDEEDEVLRAAVPPPAMEIPVVAVQEEVPPVQELTEVVEGSEVEEPVHKFDDPPIATRGFLSDDSSSDDEPVVHASTSIRADSLPIDREALQSLEGGGYPGSEEDRDPQNNDEEDDADDDEGLPVNSVVTTQSRKSVEPKKLDEAAVAPKDDTAELEVDEEEVDPARAGISKMLSRPKETVMMVEEQEIDAPAPLPGLVEEADDADIPEGSDTEDSWTLGAYNIHVEAPLPAATDAEHDDLPNDGDCLANELQDARGSGSDLGSLQDSAPPSHVSSRRSSGAMAVQGTVYDPASATFLDGTPRSDQIDSALDEGLLQDGLLVPEGIDSRRASGSPSVMDIQNATEAASLLGSHRSNQSGSSVKTADKDGQPVKQQQQEEEEEEEEKEKEEEEEKEKDAAAKAETPDDEEAASKPEEPKTLTRQSRVDELQGGAPVRSTSDNHEDSVPQSEGVISYPLVVESDEDLSPTPAEQSLLTEVLTSPQLGPAISPVGGRQDGSHRSSRQSSSVRGDCADNLGATFDPQRSSHEASPPSNVPSAREEEFPAFGENFAEEEEESSVSSGIDSPPRSSRKAPPARPQQVPALRLPPQPFQEQESAPPSMTGAKSSSRVSQVEEYYLGSPAKPEAMVVYGHTARRTANGVYKPLARTYVDAPVYFCREANTYLFRSRNGCWGIGDRPSGGLIARVQSTVASAANVTGTWKVQEESGAPWVDEPRMRLIPRKAFQSKLRESMVVVESHFIDVAGWYLRSTTRYSDVPVYFSTEANKTMWYTGSDWVISDLPGEGPCFANSVETTSKRPDTVLWFDANVYSPDLPDDLDLEDEEKDGDADENEGAEDDEQGSVVELSHGFVDEDFWPDLHSLGAQPPELQVSGLSSRAFWVRALALRSGAKPMQMPTAQWSTWELPVGKSLLRGAQGNCHVLAALAVLAEHPTFFTQKTFNGLRAASTFGQYTLSLFDAAGRAKSVTIDDYIPCRPKTLYEKTAKPIFCQPTDNELQILLVEKAMAKTCGSYLELSLLAANEGPGAVWRTLIGAVDQLRWRRELVGKGLAEWRCEVLRGANGDAEERQFCNTKSIEQEFFPKVLEHPRFKANQAVNVLCRTSQRWQRDGVVAKVLKKRTDIDGTSMPAGSVKVIYGKEATAKWIPPMHFDLELKEANFMIGDDCSVYGRTMGLWSAGKVQDTLSEPAVVEGLDLPAGSVKVSYLSGKNVKWVPPHELADQLRAVRPYVPEAAQEEDEEEKSPYMEVEEETHDESIAMFHHIRRCLEFGFLVGASTNITESEQRRGDGLIDCFPYPVQAAETIEGARLLLLRNVWGAAHRWSGAWAAGSTEWQDHPSVWPALAAKFGGLEANVVGNGPAARSSVFVMQWEDFLEVFEGLHVSPKQMSDFPKAICQQKANELFASQKL